MRQFSNFEQFSEWLDRKGLFHMDLGLERMRAAGQRPAFPLIQIIGTNGKGSTSAFLASLAAAHGLKTGLYTSPHFVSLRERIRINGSPPADALLLAKAEEIAEADVGPGLTWFEFLTLLAVAVFNQEEVELGIFEAGLGGRNDATSAFNACIQCFTSIAMDHAAVIGPGIAEIAGDKAAAIKVGATVFAMPQYAATEAVLTGCCRKHGIEPVWVEPLGADWLLGLAGSHQRANAALALAAWREFARMRGVHSDPRLERRALASAFIPGRMQHAPAAYGLPELILDGGHNPHAIQTLLAQMREPPAAIIFSALRDKNWRVTLALLVRTGAKIVILQLRNERAENAQRMADLANSISPGCAKVAPDLAQALEACPAGPVLICGSLYLLAEFYSAYPNYLDPKSSEQS